jgi:hypothetical protein
MTVIGGGRLLAPLADKGFGDHRQPRDRRRLASRVTPAHRAREKTPMKGEGSCCPGGLCRQSKRGAELHAGLQAELHAIGL